MQVLEIRNGELLESIVEQAAAQGITDAAIVTLIGAVDGFALSTNPFDDPKSHIITSYPFPAEMTATGEIIDGKPHIHAVMAIQGDRAVAGHLHKAYITTYFANVYVIPSTHHITLKGNSRVATDLITLPAGHTVSMYERPAEFND
jgi:uncharacterized protein